MAILSLLSACVAPPTAAHTAQDPVAISLDEALAKKSSQKQTGPEVAAALPRYGERVTVSFLGDATTLIADAVKGRDASWSYSVSGPQPRLPIYVQVHVKDATFNDFMSDVATQLGQRADIVINGTAVELRYRAQN